MECNLRPDNSAAAGREVAGAECRHDDAKDATDGGQVTCGRPVQVDAITKARTWQGPGR
jgi:hypothetical protein